MMASLSWLSGEPDRLGSLRRFSVTITFVTIFAHVYVGLETSYSCTVVSVLTACCVQLLIESVRAKTEGIMPGYSQGKLIDFLLPPYIVGLTCALFLFTNGRHWPMIFAATLAIASKCILRVKQGNRTLHFMNPSNLCIVVTLVAYPAVAVIMPFSLSAGLGNVGDILFPVVLFIAGCILNTFYTKRILLILAWFLSFVLQAVTRHVLLDAQLIAMLAFATGPIAIIFSFYMISDPATTPSRPMAQVAFGGSIGVFYGILTAAHVVYGIFWALLLTCAVRGLYMRLAESSEVDVTSLEVRQAGA